MSEVAQKRLARRMLRGTALLLALSAVSTPAAAQGKSLGALLKSKNATMQAQWGQRYEHGEGVAQNYDHAVQLYCRAAIAGNRDANFQLGWMYANGRGVARNDRQAAAWFKVAAGKGDKHAVRMLKRLPKPSTEPQCIRPNGALVDQPINGAPNPPRALIVKWVKQLAPRYKLDPALVLAVIRAESNFNPKAKSHANAQGLMQLIPGTAKRFDVGDVWDPLQNIRGGMAYLRWLLDHFEGDEALALAGYNAGENAVRRYNGIPPYPETRSYVKRVSRWRLNPIPGTIPVAAPADSRRKAEKPA